MGGLGEMKGARRGAEQRREEKRREEKRREQKMSRRCERAEEQIKVPALAMPGLTPSGKPARVCSAAVRIASPPTCHGATVSAQRARGHSGGSGAREQGRKRAEAAEWSGGRKQEAEGMEG